jgi:protein gp37
MAKDSKIEWTHHTFNPWWGCERVSPACKHCYAETWAHRMGFNLWEKGAPRRELSDPYWRQPLSWNHEAGQNGQRARVFCASMADVFEGRSDLDRIRQRLWGLIEQTPNLDWLLLTKRPEHVSAMTPWQNTWPDNVWLGTTVETQRWAERRIPHLLQNPAAVLFLSCEPMLGPIDLTPWLAAGNHNRAIDWVIAGGESGHKARPMNPEWPRVIRDQCALNGVAFHFKQWGNWRPASGYVNGHTTRKMANSTGDDVMMIKIGKKSAGRRLDGRHWNDLPWHA